MKGYPELTVFIGIDPTEYKPVAVNQHHRYTGKRVIFRGEIHAPLQDGLLSPGSCGPTHDERDKNTCFERSEEHTSELQSLMRISYAVFCLKKKNIEQYYNNRSMLATNKITSLQNHI